MKAQNDKLAEDAIEQKASFDSQLAKAVFDAGDIKVQYDKLCLDVSEQKAVFDTIIHYQNAKEHQIQASLI